MPLVKVWYFISEETPNRLRKSITCILRKRIPTRLSDIF